ALPAPTERQKSQMFIQRYIEQFPAAGGNVIFYPSWYNRGGGGQVMGFVSGGDYARLLKIAPIVEKNNITCGILFIKFWLEVGKDEQERRFHARIDDPMRQWKLSPMDVESYTHWDDYSKARDMMLEATDSKVAPWYIIRSDDKRRARLNCISHIL